MTKSGAFAVKAMLVLVAGAMTMAAAAQVFDAKDATATSIATLKHAVHKQRNGSHLPLLFSLRQMRDPDLKPLFYQLKQSGDWPMQVHAVLGLAEIDPNRRVDTWLITNAAPEAQEAIIANALDLGLLAEDQFGPILAWDALHPMARLLLFAELVSQRKAVDVGELARLSHAEDLFHAAMASALLAQIGDAGGWTSLQSRVPSLDDNERKRLTMWLLDAVGRYRLDFARQWVQSLLNDANVDDDIAYRGVHTLIKLDPAAGLAAWNRRLGDAAPTNRRVRFGLSLLAVGPEVPPATYDRLNPSQGECEDLIARMIAVGRAQSAGEDPAPAMIALLDSGHIKSIEWVMDRALTLKPEQAARIYMHLIDKASDAKAPPDAISLGVKATAKLYESDAGAVLDRLAKAEDDSPQQQMILLGLFEPRGEQIGQAAAGLRRMGASRADSLALLLMAKNGVTLNERDRQQLGRIAAGAGQVSDVLQVQAAWLYLKHTGQIEQALAAIFAEARVNAE